MKVGDDGFDGGRPNYADSAIRETFGQLAHEVTVTDQVAESRNSVVFALDQRPPEPAAVRNVDSPDRGCVGIAPAADTIEKGAGSVRDRERASVAFGVLER